MNTTDVLVIGSSAAGLVAALTSKRVYPDKKVIVTTMSPKTLIPCGIPYIFGTVGTSEKDILPADKMFEANGIEMIVEEAKSINLKEKEVEYVSGRTNHVSSFFFCHVHCPVPFFHESIKGIC